VLGAHTQVAQGTGVTLQGTQATMVVGVAGGGSGCKGSGVLMGLGGWLEGDVDIANELDGSSGCGQ